MYIIVCSKNNICLKVNVFFIKTKQTETKYCSLVRMYVLLEALPNGKKSHTCLKSHVQFSKVPSLNFECFEPKGEHKSIRTMCQFFSVRRRSSSIRAPSEFKPPKCDQLKCNQLNSRDFMMNGCKILTEVKAVVLLTFIQNNQSLKKFETIYNLSDKSEKIFAKVSPNRARLTWAIIRSNLVSSRHGSN